MKTITDLLEQQKLAKQKRVEIEAEKERQEQEKKKESTLKMYEFIRDMISVLTTDYIDGMNETCLVKEIDESDYYLTCYIPEELNKMFNNEAFRTVKVPDYLSNYGWEWTNEYITIKIFREDSRHSKPKISVRINS